MKTDSHPIITSAEGNENASASILNQNVFFRVIFAFFAVLFDGCSADMETQWLLKYSLQRAGMKQSHILGLFYSSGLTFLQQSQRCKHPSALNKKQQHAGLKDCFSFLFFFFFSGPMRELFYLSVSASLLLFNNHAKLKALPLLLLSCLMKSVLKYPLPSFFPLKGQGLNQKQIWKVSVQMLVL